MSQDDTINKWAWLWAVIALVAIAATAYLYIHPRVTTITQTQFKTVPQIQKVVDVQRVYVPVKQVVALDKHAVAQKLDMPWLEGTLADAAPAAVPAASSAPVPGLATAGEVLPAPPPAAVVVADPAPVAGDPQDLQVTTTADIPQSENGFEAASVLDTKTGESTLVVKEKVAPWLQFESGVVAGLRYGLATSGQQTGTAYAGWEFLRIKDIHLIGYGEINTDVAGKIQLDLQYRLH